MRHHPLRIVVTGLAATFPVGGVFWDYMQYVLGFKRLGHDVLYLEDTARWCYSRTQQTFVEHGDENAQFLGEHLPRLDPDLRERWHYLDAAGQSFGMARDAALAFCREADLFLNISAACKMRPEYREAQRLAFIDSDPMYTQSAVPEVEAGTADEETVRRVESLRRHDAHLTFGERIGRPDCAVPTGMFDWRPTRQPIVLDALRPHARPVRDRRPVFTTIGSWEPAEGGPLVHGVQYSGKSSELHRFLELPERTEAQLELALGGDYPAELFERHGWRLRPADEVSTDPWVYRDYLASSFGEWSVAKQAYVASRSGWFSCRSACYLAMGVPVVVQDTGFSEVLPTGEGLLAFRTLEEAAAALDRVRSAPAVHARAAQELASAYFDAESVLSRLLEEVFAAEAKP